MSGEARFEAIRRVVEPGVQHSAVPSAGVCPQHRFLLKQNDTLITEPSFQVPGDTQAHHSPAYNEEVGADRGSRLPRYRRGGDRKSTRLNSSHSQNSYAVFCLKKKKKTEV